MRRDEAKQFQTVKGGRPAAVQFMITHAMRADLSGLGYTETDINSLSPERARAIIDNSIQRPASGVPREWLRSGSGGRGRSGGALGKAFGALRQATLGSLAVALALHFSGMDMGVFSEKVDALVKIMVESTAPPRQGVRL